MRFSEVKIFVSQSQITQLGIGIWVYIMVYLTGYTQNCIFWKRENDHKRHLCRICRQVVARDGVRVAVGGAMPANRSGVWA